MRAIFKSLLLLISFITILNPSKATTFAGGEISYLCLGGNSYQITLRFYRDCSGASLPMTVPMTFECSSNSNIGFTENLDLIMGTGYEVTNNCPAIPTTCANGSNYGIQIYEYQAVVNLAACDNWKIKITGCCRNTSQNIVSSPSNFIYLEAHLDNLNAPCSSSPQFSNSPILVTCDSNSTNYCHGTIDPDGDSLSYQFITPWDQGPGSSYPTLSFWGTNTTNQPFISNPPISLDNSTGCISFNPSENYVNTFAIKVEKWRSINGSMQKIGDVIRDMQFKIQDCNNSLPKLGGMDFSLNNGYSPLDTTFLYHAGWGQNINFNIWGHDIDTFNQMSIGYPENFDIKWNNGIPSGSFTTYYPNTDSAFAAFSWTPLQSDSSSSPHCFTATIYDEACPYIGIQSYAYCILVDLPNNLNETINQFDFQIYPNPAQKTLTVKSVGIIGMKKITFFSFSGQKISELESDQTSISISLETLDPGIYFISIETKKGRRVKKLIIK